MLRQIRKDNLLPSDGVGDLFLVCPTRLDDPEETCGLQNGKNIVPGPSERDWQDNPDA